MRGDVATRFLNHAKKEFHDSAEQQALQEIDRRKGKRVQQGKHSRWARNTQKLGGTPQMWTLLSFTGRFDVAFLEESIEKGAPNPTNRPGNRTKQQKQHTRNAKISRGLLRQGRMLDRLENKTSSPVSLLGSWES